MKRIDCSAAHQSKTGKLGSLLARKNRAWTAQETQSQSVFVQALQRSLDNHYFLLENLVLEGPDIPVPLLLIGPGGVWMIYASGEKGVFRARDDAWDRLDERRKNYQPVKPNLLTRAQMMAQAVETYLKRQMGFSHSIEPVLFFSNPGVHVDFLRPTARIVQTDALERFISSLTAAQAILDQATVQQIVRILAGELAAVGEARQTGEIHDAYSMLEIPDEKPVKRRPIVTMDTSEPDAFRKVPFSKRQLLLLGVFILVDIAVLVAVILLAVSFLSAS